MKSFNRKRSSLNWQRALSGDDECHADGKIERRSLALAKSSLVISLVGLAVEPSGSKAQSVVAHVCSGLLVPAKDTKESKGASTVASTIIASGGTCYFVNESPVGKRIFSECALNEPCLVVALVIPQRGGMLPIIEVRAVERRINKRQPVNPSVKRTSTLPLIQEGAAQGRPLEQYSLALKYKVGDEVPQDYAEAATWFRKAAEQGHAQAQLELALLYDEGIGVNKNPAEAASWYRRAAQQGVPLAQYNLGLSYFEATGVDQSNSEAAAWYRRAAEQGFDEAQNNLGAMYMLGLGVPQDYVIALHWYRKAAERGHAGAQLNLARKYVEGKGVKQDLVQAYKWFNLAAVGLQGEDHKVAIESRSNVAAKMTTRQIEQAQRLTRDWKPVTPPLR